MEWRKKAMRMREAPTNGAGWRCVGAADERCARTTRDLLTMLTATKIEPEFDVAARWKTGALPVPTAEWKAGK